MEPKGKRVKKIDVKSQIATKSTDNSGGRATGTAKKPGASTVTTPMAPPRLKSRSGGTVVKDATKQKPKR